jgi:hypothetical protein
MPDFKLWSEGVVQRFAIWARREGRTGIEQGKWGFRLILLHAPRILCAYLLLSFGCRSGFLHDSEPHL